MLHFRAMMAAFCCLLAVAAHAQSAPDYAAWELVATRAEASVDNGRASTSAFEQLRSNLAEFRAEFQAAQDTNANRIRTLRAQLTGLGPVPADGETEPRDIADRRAELQRQLDEVSAPQLRAVEAYNRADGLIDEIDALVRARQTDRLLELGPTPLNPVFWPDALTALSETLGETLSETSIAASSDNQRRRLTENTPIILGLLALSLVLFLRAGGWIGQLLGQLPGDGLGARDRLVRDATAIARTGASILAVAAIANALSLTTLFGFRGQILLGILPLAGLAFFGGRWAGSWLVPDAAGTARGAAIIRVSGYLGLIWAVDRLLISWADYDAYSPAVSAVLHFPLVLFAALLLLRMTRLIAARPSQDEQPIVETELGFRERVKRWLGWLTFAVSIAAPISAAVGYLSLAVATIFPTILTLALVGTLFGLTAMLRDVYTLVTRKDEAAAAESLTPVLVNLVVVLISLPVLLMIWGMRPQELLELWVAFRDGVQIGDARISPGDFVTFAVVFIIGYIATRALQSTLRSSILPKTRIDPGAQVAMISGIGYLGIFLAALIAISTAGIDLSSLAIVAGALSVGIGFGLQNIVSNFVSGIILLIERPISEGDWIEVNGQAGYVRNVSVRSTRVETFDRSDVIIPNADLVSGTVTNYTRGNLIGRVIVPVSVAYGSDTRKVSEILLEIAKAHPMVTLNPPPNVLFVNLGADGLDFEIRAILRDVNWVMSVRSDMNHEIAKRFGEEGIEIPFAQRDIWLRNPEQLAGLASGGGDES